MASGEKYASANEALVESGFQRGDAGVFRLPAVHPNVSRTNVAGLVRCAKAHGVAVTISSRRFIGDAANYISALLPSRPTHRR